MIFKSNLHTKNADKNNYFLFKKSIKYVLLVKPKINIFFNDLKSNLRFYKESCSK